MATSLEGQITALTQRYYALASRDHHKDRDCHFWVAKHWEYGNKPVYNVRHYGYLNELPDPVAHTNYRTAEEAELALIEFLEKAVADLESHDPEEGWS